MAAAVASTIDAEVASGGQEAPETIEKPTLGSGPSSGLDDREAVRWHGLLGVGRNWSPPKLAAATDATARPGYKDYDASEYLDTPEVSREKVKLLAEMWSKSRACVVYTGAGLSTAAGIGDYASKASGSVAPHRGSKGSTSNRLELKPTLGHHALAALESKGMIGNWIQQNHDRLAQKAGYPQAKLNEIHGAWGDNKNQVKMMDDSLREDLLEWLIRWSEEADMCVALGTTMCGMNADQVAMETSKRFMEGSGQGLVIVGLQRSFFDEQASLHFWGLCDNVLKAVAQELGIRRLPVPAVAQRGEAWTGTHPRCTYHTPKRSSRDPM